jgi:hypothetical protein
MRLFLASLKAQKERIAAMYVQLKSTGTRPNAIIKAPQLRTSTQT